MPRQGRDLHGNVLRRQSGEQHRLTMQRQRDDMHGGVLRRQGEGTLCKYRRRQSSQEPSKGFARSGLEMPWNGIARHSVPQRC